MSETEDRRTWAIVEKTNARSRLWKYFRVYSHDRMPQVAICNMCHAKIGDPLRYEVRIGDTKSTSPMLQHLKYTHREIYLLEPRDERPKIQHNHVAAAELFSPSRFPSCLLKWIVLSSQPLSVCEDKNFRAMCEVLKPKHEGITQFTLLSHLEKMSKHHNQLVSDVLCGQHISISNYVWTQNEREYYAHTSCSFISQNWERTTITLNYSKLSREDKETLSFLGPSSSTSSLYSSFGHCL